MSDPPKRLPGAAQDADKRFGGRAAAASEVGSPVDPCQCAVVVGVTERGRALSSAWGSSPRWISTSSA